MVEAGVNIKVIQDALGHSDISTTMKIYADVSKELKKSEFEGLVSFSDNTDKVITAPGQCLGAVFGNYKFVV